MVDWISKNCSPVEYELHVQELFVKNFCGSSDNSFKDLKSDWDLGVVKERLRLNIFVWLRALFSIHL